MPKKREKIVEKKSTQQIDGCFASHHFVQVSEPSLISAINTIGGGHFKGDAPRGVRLFCMQCGQTLELGS